MQIMRREVKFTIPLLEYKKLEPRLMLAMHPDATAGQNGRYRVRSLYFDSFGNDDYLDVIKGLETRKKIRLRIYSPQDEVVKLEYKRKQGVNQQKTSILLSKEQAHQLILGKYSILSEHPDARALPVYRDLLCGVYRPKVIIEYERQAFAAPGNDIRITFDSKISAAWNTTDLFSTQVNFTPLIAEDYGVLEVKYTRFLYTYLQDILRKLDALPNAMSKYVLGRADRW